jgi:hypothetical protein
MHCQKLTIDHTWYRILIKWIRKCFIYFLIVFV